MADLPDGPDDLARQLERTRAELAAMEATWSWRVTRPLRAVRRRWRPAPVPPAAASTGEGSAPPRAARTHSVDATGARFALVSRALTGEDPPDEADAPAGFAALAASLELDEGCAAWLGWWAAAGRLATEAEVDALARRVRMFGWAELAAVLAQLAPSVEPALVLDERLVTDLTLIDVTHTAATTLRTGVQRVARETTRHWLARHPDALAVRFDEDRARWVALPRSVFDDDGGLPPTPGDVAVGESLLPWRCRLIVPELFGEPARCDAIRAGVLGGGFSSIGLIAFDLIPVIAPETTVPGMAEYFGRYLSVVKQANRVVAISETSAECFRAFGRMLAAEGRVGPEVAVLPPPAEMGAESPRPGTPAASPEPPIVLVVGSHEPRKNHGTVLESAEALWAEGRRFSLWFIGGNRWRTEGFDELVTQLQARGRDVRVDHALDDGQVAEAYAAARFSVFPSLLEGYGLPIVESLAAGTPVVASAHGATAEAAFGGGCLLVDPRDPDAVRRTMAALLDDDGLVARLRREARGRPGRSWSGYAARAWRELLPEGRR